MAQMGQWGNTPEAETGERGYGGTWSGWRRWTWLARACLAGLILADVWLGRPVPGLGGRHLVLLVGIVLAALTWIAWLPAERVSPRVRVPLLVIGMVAACLAALVSPSTAATALPSRSASWLVARLPCWKVPGWRPAASSPWQRARCS